MAKEQELGLSPSVSGGKRTSNNNRPVDPGIYKKDDKWKLSVMKILAKEGIVEPDFQGSIILEVRKVQKPDGTVTNFLFSKKLHPQPHLDKIPASALAVQW